MSDCGPTDWTTVYPRAKGDWTMHRVASDGAGLWGALQPEVAAVQEADPAQDPRLPGIAAAIGWGAALVSYRVGRRAVLRGRDGTWFKALRPSRAEQAEQAWALATQRDPSSDGPATPEVLAVHPEVGLIELGHLPGCALHDRLMSSEFDPDEVAATLECVGASLAGFHGSSTSAGHPTARTRTEPDPPHQWVDIAQRGLSAGLLSADEVEALDRTARQLEPLELPASSAVVHGDLHDKNILVGNMPPGLIDLDGVGVGCPETDMANLAVHIELRAMQCGRDPGEARAHALALYDGYRNVRHLRGGLLAECERHVWFRLSVLYRFRRSGVGLTDAMLARVVGD